MTTTAMTPEQKYLFDLQGYLILKNVVPQSDIEAANRVLDQLKAMAPEDLPPPLHHVPNDNAITGLFITNILEAAPEMRAFMQFPEVLGVVAGVTGGPWRLNHTATIIGNGSGQTLLHGGATPGSTNLQYSVHNGQMRSTLTKAVFPLLPCRPEDGCFAAIPGSHKSAFPRPWTEHPNDNPPLQPIVAAPGDAIVFTEALTHGSMVNSSGRERRTLYYCYSMGLMADWRLHGTRFSPELDTKVTETEREILAVK